MEKFEAASRIKLRFVTPKGLLTAEDLWDLPLTSTKGAPNLDDIARHYDDLLRTSSATRSFVTPAANTSQKDYELAFEIAKHVIDVKIEQRNAAALKAKRAEQKQQLLGIIASKESEALAGKSLDELKKMAEEL